VPRHRQRPGSFLKHRELAETGKAREQILGLELRRPEEIEVPGATMSEMQGERRAAGEVEAPHLGEAAQ
jgi:hypothetical protein